MMRLGGPAADGGGDPEVWAAGVRELGYTAAWVPVTAESPEDVVQGFVRAAKRANVVIAEVGAWSNPISRDDGERKKAIAYCQRQLDLAEQLGALCCANIAGSRGEKWDGPDVENYSAATFDLIVSSVREIIDVVKPVRSCYSLETMPWVPPDSPESYLELIRAIDRKEFGVHLDPVNMINCPRRACDTAGFLRECFAKLGPFVKSCHAKDIRFTQHLTVHLDECRPGTGMLDYAVFLREISKLPADTPLMIEHLANAGEYRAAAEFIRGVAREVGVTWV